MKREIFFTTKDGVIGTAHKNRSGKIVDFRPATIMFNEGGNKYSLLVLSQKGQNINPLKIEADRVEKVIKEKEDDGREIFVYRIFGNFEGIEFFADSNWQSEPTDKNKEEVERKRENEKLARKKLEGFLLSISLSDIAAYPFSRRSIGRLSSRLVYYAKMMDEAVCHLATQLNEDAQKKITWENIYSVIKNLGGEEKIKNAILDADEKRRQEKKKAWLERK
jgi:hypothetical protein